MQFQTKTSKTFNNHINKPTAVNGSEEKMKMLYKNSINGSTLSNLLNRNTFNNKIKGNEIETKNYTKKNASKSVSSSRTPQITKNYDANNIGVSLKLKMEIVNGKLISLTKNVDNNKNEEPITTTIYLNINPRGVMSKDQKKIHYEYNQENRKNMLESENISREAKMKYLSTESCILAGKSIQYEQSEYVLVKLLQTAIYGCVYVAKSTEYINKTVVKSQKAIKLLSKDLIEITRHSVQEDPLSEYFYRDIMSGHSNVLSCDTIFDDGQYVYMVMPFAIHGDLFEVMKNRNAPLSEEEGRYLFYQILLAVKFLHSKKLAMRDISLENVLLFENEKNGLVYPVLNDPGQAIFFKVNEKEEVILEPFQRIFGKVFRPPEIHEQKDYDPTKIDIFCIGYILYFCLTKYELFRSASSKDAYWNLLKNKNYERLLIEKNGEHLSIEVLDLVFKCLEYDFNKRYTIEDMLNHPWFKKTMIPLTGSTIFTGDFSYCTQKDLCNISSELLKKEKGKILKMADNTKVRFQITEHPFILPVDECNETYFENISPWKKDFIKKEEKKNNELTKCLSIESQNSLNIHITENRKTENAILCQNTISSHDEKSVRVLKNEQSEIMKKEENEKKMKKGQDCYNTTNTKTDTSNEFNDTILSANVNKKNQTENINILNQYSNNIHSLLELQTNLVVPHSQKIKCLESKNDEQTLNNEPYNLNVDQPPIKKRNIPKVSKDEEMKEGKQTPNFKKELEKELENETEKESEKESGKESEKKCQDNNYKKKVINKIEKNGNSKTLLNSPSFKKDKHEIKNDSGYSNLLVQQENKETNKDSIIFLNKCNTQNIFSFSESVISVYNNSEMVVKNEKLEHKHKNVRNDMVALKQFNRKRTYDTTEHEMEEKEKEKEKEKESGREYEIEERKGKEKGKRKESPTHNQYDETDKYIYRIPDKIILKNNKRKKINTQPNNENALKNNKGKILQVGKFFDSIIPEKTNKKIKDDSVDCHIENKEKQDSQKKIINNKNCHNMKLRNSKSKEDSILIIQNDKVLAAEEKDEEKNEKKDEKKDNTMKLKKEDENIQKKNNLYDKLKIQWKNKNQTNKRSTIAYLDVSEKNNEQLIKREINKRKSRKEEIQMEKQSRKQSGNQTQAQTETQTQTQTQIENVKKVESSYNLRSTMNIFPVTRKETLQKKKKIQSSESGSNQELNDILPLTEDFPLIFNNRLKKKNNSSNINNKKLDRNNKNRSINDKRSHKIEKGNMLIGTVSSLPPSSNIPKKNITITKNEKPLKRGFSSDALIETQKKEEHNIEKTIDEFHRNQLSREKETKEVETKEVETTEVETKEVETKEVETKEEKTKRNFSEELKSSINKEINAFLKIDNQSINAGTLNNSLFNNTENCLKNKKENLLNGQLNTDIFMNISKINTHIKSVINKEKNLEIQKYKEGNENIVNKIEPETKLETKLEIEPEKNNLSFSTIITKKEKLNHISNVHIEKSKQQNDMNMTEKKTDAALENIPTQLEQSVTKKLCNEEKHAIINNKIENNIKPGVCNMIDNCLKTSENISINNHITNKQNNKDTKDIDTLLILASAVNTRQRENTNESTQRCFLENINNEIVNVTHKKTICKKENMNETKNETINETKNETINETKNETINETKNETYQKVDFPNSKKYIDKKNLEEFLYDVNNDVMKKENSEIVNKQKVEKPCKNIKNKRGNKKNTMDINQNIVLRKSIILCEHNNSEKKEIKIDEVTEIEDLSKTSMNRKNRKMKKNSESTIVKGENTTLKTQKGIDKNFIKNNITNINIIKKGLSNYYKKKTEINLEKNSKKTKVETGRIQPQPTFLCVNNYIAEKKDIYEKGKKPIEFFIPLKDRYAYPQLKPKYDFKRKTEYNIKNEYNKTKITKQNRNDNQTNLKENMKYIQMETDENTVIFNNGDVIKSINNNGNKCDVIVSPLLNISAKNLKMNETIQQEVRNSPYNLFAGHNCIDSIQKEYIKFEKNDFVSVIGNNSKKKENVLINGSLNTAITKSNINMNVNSSSPTNTCFPNIMKNQRNTKKQKNRNTLLNKIYQNKLIRDEKKYIKNTEKKNVFKIKSEQIKNVRTLESYFEQLIIDLKNKNQKTKREEEEEEEDATTVETTTENKTEVINEKEIKGTDSIYKKMKMVFKNKKKLNNLSKELKGNFLLKEKKTCDEISRNTNTLKSLVPNYTTFDNNNNNNKKSNEKIKEKNKVEKKDTMGKMQHRFVPITIAKINKNDTNKVIINNCKNKYMKSIDNAFNNTINKSKSNRKNEETMNNKMNNNKNNKTREQKTMTCLKNSVNASPISMCISTNVVKLATDLTEVINNTDNARNSIEKPINKTNMNTFDYSEKETMEIDTANKNLQLPIKEKQFPIKCENLLPISYENIYINVSNNAMNKVCNKEQKVFPLIDTIYTKNLNQDIMKNIKQGIKKETKSSVINVKGIKVEGREGEEKGENRNSIFAKTPEVMKTFKGTYFNLPKKRQTIATNIYKYDNQKETRYTYINGCDYINECNYENEDNIFKMLRESNIKKKESNVNHSSGIDVGKNNVTNNCSLEQKENLTLKINKLINRRSSEEYIKIKNYVNVENDINKKVRNNNNDVHLNQIKNIRKSEMIWNNTNNNNKNNNNNNNNDVYKNITNINNAKNVSYNELKKKAQIFPVILTQQNGNQIPIWKRETMFETDKNVFFNKNDFFDKKNSSYFKNWNIKDFLPKKLVKLVN